MRSKANVFLHKCKRRIQNFINLLFRKDTNKVFFDSFPDYADNSRAFSDYLLSNPQYSHLKIYWAVDDYLNIDDAIIQVRCKGLWGRLSYIYHTVTAKYLFSTHGAFDWCNPSKQTFVCFWHGTMLKRIVLMQNPDNMFYLNNVTYFISPSEFYIDIYAKSFGAKRENILLTGYPRCDLLFKEDFTLHKLGLSEVDKKILYMPTFRKPVGGGYVDSKTNVFTDSFINLSDISSIERWNEFFKSLDIIFIIKPHPADSSIVKFGDLSNIKMITNEDLNKYDIQLYSLLKEANALITDYSSVYCDYLLLDRPIGFMINDIEDYANNRGFVFDNPLEYLPGELVSQECEFVNFCESVSSGIDSSCDKRHRLAPIYNKYIDSDACKRIASFINL